MFLVLLFLTLLHAVDCPGWQSRTVAMTRGGWTALPRAPASCRTHPMPMAVATAAVPAPAPPPWGGTRDRTPEPPGGCLYAHSPRGRPGPRRWPWLLFGGGVRPGQWPGSPRGSGGLAVEQRAQPPRHCGSPSHRVRPAWRPADPPFPRTPPAGESPCQSFHDQECKGDWHYQNQSCFLCTRQRLRSSACWESLTNFPTRQWRPSMHGQQP